MERVSRDDVAVFVDFENVYVSVREKFDATPNFELIMDRCEDYGRIVIARAYADWYRYPRVTSALFANGVEPMYVPTYYYDRDLGRTGRPIKNSVDIHLCIDAMRTLYTEPNIAKYVLVTGDRDFIPLVNAIRQRGKDVIIIGIGGAASAHLAQSADEFLFYEQIADLKAAPQAAPVEEPRRSEERRERPERSEERRERPERSRSERPPRPEPAPVATEPRTNGNTPAAPAAEPVPEMDPETAAPRTAFDTLVDAIKLARQRGFVVNLGSLKVVMRELDSNFHESKVKDANGKGFSKFKDFVKEAERLGKVQIFTNGTLTEIFLPGEDAYRMSVFAEDLASQKAERELESELAQQVEEIAAPVDDFLATPEAIVEVPAEMAFPEPLVETFDPQTSSAVASIAAAPETSEPAVRQTFGDREWDVFRSSMSQFTDPVRFAEIFNALRGLRNQEVVELTNNELKELVKQAINRGMLQRTGRGARAYYRLNSQYRIARPDVEPVAEQPASPPVVLNAEPVGEEPVVEAPVATPARRRRVRSYGEVAPVITAVETAPEEPSIATAPEIVEGEGAISSTEPVETSAEQTADEQPAGPSKSARRRSRRKAAGQSAAAEVVEEQPAAVEEQPAEPAQTGKRRPRRKPSKAEAAQADEGEASAVAQSQPAAATQAEEPEAAAPRKRNRRKKPATDGSQSSAG